MRGYDTLWMATNNTCNTKYAKRCLRCWQPLLFYNDMAVFKEPAYRATMRLIPGLSPFCLSHLGSLIQFNVAAVHNAAMR